MKRSMAVIAAVFALASCDGTQVAAPASEVLLAKGGNGGVKVSGSGHFNATGEEVDWRTFSFHAKLNADGTADGKFNLHARQSEPENKIHGDVVCVAVVGNQAWMVGLVTSSDGVNSPPGTFTRFRVVDNGEGANSPPDQISLMTVGLVNMPQYCVNRPADPALHNIEAGNVQVH